MNQIDQRANITPEKPKEGNMFQEPVSASALQSQSNLPVKNDGSNSTCTKISNFIQSQNWKFVFFQCLAFLCCCFGYNMAPFSRSAFSFTKPYMINDERDSISKTLLGTVDLFWCAFYAVPMLFTSNLNDRFNPRFTLAFGHLCIAISQTLLGLAKAYHFVNVFSFAAFQALNGFGQTFHFPGYSGVLGNWFSVKNKLIALLLWNCSTFIGNTLGTISAKNVIQVWGLRWDWVFYVTTFVHILMALCDLFILPTNPANYALPEVSKKKGNEGSASPIIGNRSPVVILQNEEKTPTLTPLKKYDEVPSPLVNPGLKTDEIKLMEEKNQTNVRNTMTMKPISFCEALKMRYLLN